MLFVFTDLPLSMAAKVAAIVAPSVLAADFTNLGAECERVIEGGSEWIHLDVMDGHFVPNISFGFPVIKSLSQYLSSRGYLHPNGAPPSKAGNGPIRVVRDVHIMVEDPKRWIPELKECGADHVTFHIEACPSLEYAIETAEELRKNGMTVGIAVRPKTGLDDVIAVIQKTGDLIALILVMSVEPGFGGQKFDHTVLPKCTLARKLFPHIHIQMDGGLNAETSALGAKAGANVIVAGTSVFASTDPRSAIEAIKRAIRENGSHLED